MMKYMILITIILLMVSCPTGCPNGAIDPVVKIKAYIQNNLEYKIYFFLTNYYGYNFNESGYVEQNEIKQISYNEVTGGSFIPSDGLLIYAPSNLNKIIFTADIVDTREWEHSYNSDDECHEFILILNNELLDAQNSEEKK